MERGFDAEGTQLIVILYTPLSISKGTITKEQSDKILAHDKEVFRSLSVEQKGALRTAMETARKDSLEKLVKNGKITQEQADILSKVRGNHKKD